MRLEGSGSRSALPRQLLIGAGLLLLIVGGISAWRAANPPLTPDQQIARELTGLEAAIESRSVGGVTGYLAEDFSFNGIGKQELRRSLQAAFAPIGAGVRDIQVDFSAVHVEIQSPNDATSSGNYSAAFRVGEGGPETRRGRFNCTWKKVDGEWKISRVTGGIDPRSGDSLPG